MNEIHVHNNRRFLYVPRVALKIRTTTTIRLMRGLITLVNDTQVDNYIKEILAFIYYGSAVNNRSKYGLCSNFRINRERR